MNSVNQEQRQTLSQKLLLTQSMRQSIECLQRSAQELDAYVSEIALSNPLLEVQSPTWYETEMPKGASDAEDKQIELQGLDDRLFPTFPRGNVTPDSYLTKEKNLREYLNEQIGQMKLVDDRLRNLCGFLIGCLNERGYLDCPLEELAVEVGCTVFELEQALYVIQMLEPSGVGARNLSECLMLQLLQKKKVNSLEIAIVREGLRYLGKHDYVGLAAHLGANVKEVQAAVAEIMELTPVPARGFADGAPTTFIAPDAVFHVDHGQLVIEINESILPKLSINEEYTHLLTESEDPVVRRYVRDKLSEAKSLIRGVYTRSDTLLKLISMLGEVQQDFFLYGGDLVPITMQELAGQLNMSVSTVSRTAQSKYIQFRGETIPIRALFATATTFDADISNQAIKQQIRNIVDREARSAPLSDEKIRLELQKLGMPVSRRAVTKYRIALGIPASGQRKNFNREIL